VNQATILLIPNEANPLGVIGEVPDGKGGVIKGHMLIDVITQVSKFPTAQSFLFLCAGPGGDVEVGDQIYDYMEGLKTEGKRIDTATAGDIGSIMTKPFLAGQEREIREEDKLYVHAPWVPHLEGNATQITRGLSSLYKDENKLLDFYKKKTGITEAGLKGLMAGTTDQDGTFMTADQAVALKFATKKATSKIKAFAQIKNQNMSKETQTLGQKLGALIDIALGNKAASKALELPSEKGNISVSSEDPANLVGADATMPDAAGAAVPVPDGEHKLTDGRILVVAGGKVKEVKAAAAAAQVVTPAPDANAAVAAELATVKAELAALKAVPAVNIEEKIAAAMNEIKSSISGGKTPPKGFNNTGGAPKKDKELSPIQLAMRKTE
jgi:ATP-dependent protease ClpP protease subunit